MRCEICGAPVVGEETRCERCKLHPAYSLTPEVASRPTLAPESVPPEERAYADAIRASADRDYPEDGEPISPSGFGGPISSIPPRASLSERPLRESDADYAEDRKRALPRRTKFRRGCCADARLVGPFE